MGQIGQFLSHHWMLCGAFALVIIAIFVMEARTAGIGMGTALSPQMVIQAINRDQAVVIDIRDATLFRDGHIAGAINVPLSDWDVSEKKLQKFKTKQVIIADATGQKANTYLGKLVKQDFQNVKTLSGGLTAWRNAKLPLKKGKE